MDSDNKPNFRFSWLNWTSSKLLKFLFFLWKVPFFIPKLFINASNYAIEGIYDVPEKIQQRIEKRRDAPDEENQKKQLPKVISRSELEKQLNETKKELSRSTESLHTTEKELQHNKSRCKEFEEKLNQTERRLGQTEQSLQKAVTEKEDALTRLSQMVSVKLRDNNPNIVDLNDMYRPTKLAEMFSELYDNEWTSAYAALEDEYEGPQIVSFLLDIVMESYTFSIGELGGMWTHVNEWFLKERFPWYQQTKKSLKDGMKIIAAERAAVVTEKFMTHMQSFCGLSKIDDLLSDNRLRDYIGESVKLSLLMGACDPPVIIVCEDWKPLEDRGSEERHTGEQTYGRQSTNDQPPETDDKSETNGDDNGDRAKGEEEDQGVKNDGDKMHVEIQTKKHPPMSDNVSEINQDKIDIRATKVDKDVENDDDKTHIEIQSKGNLLNSNDKSGTKGDDTGDRANKEDKGIENDGDKTHEEVQTKEKSQNSDNMSEINEVEIGDRATEEGKDVENDDDKTHRGIQSEENLLHSDDKSETNEDDTCNLVNEDGKCVENDGDKVHGGVHYEENLQNANDKPGTNEDYTSGRAEEEDKDVKNVGDESHENVQNEDNPQNSVDKAEANKDVTDDHGQTEDKGVESDGDKTEKGIKMNDMVEGNDTTKTSVIPENQKESQNGHGTYTTAKHDGKQLAEEGEVEIKKFNNNFDEEENDKVNQTESINCNIEESKMRREKLAEPHNPETSLTENKSKPNMEEPIMNERRLFDKTHYKEYTERGKYLLFYVWPAMFLHKDGPLVAKGVAQGTKKACGNDGDLRLKWWK